MNGSRKILAIIAGLVLGGCASTSSVNTRYGGEAPAAPFQRILLVGRTPEAEVREVWELRCDRRFEVPGVNLIRSHKVMPLWYEAGNEPLLKWAVEHDADAILVAELTGLLLAPPQMPPQDFTRTERGLGDGPGTATPTWSITLGKEERAAVPPEQHHIEFLLMNAAGEVVWDGIVSTDEANDLQAIAGSQCEALAGTLRALGFVP